jgi:hypothetical protein
MVCFQGTITTSLGIFRKLFIVEAKTLEGKRYKILWPDKKTVNADGF